MTTTIDALTRAVRVSGPTDLELALAQCYRVARDRARKTRRMRTASLKRRPSDDGLAVADTDESQHHRQVYPSAPVNANGPTAQGAAT